MGSLTVITGPMYSGKSEELIRLLRRAVIGGKRTVLLRPDIDDRYDGYDLVSHAGSLFPARSITPKAGQIQAATHSDYMYDVIGVDEIQFFTPDHFLVKDVLIDLADKGKDVIVSGLDMTYRRDPFGCVPDLMAVADRVLKLDSVCHKCGGIATLTQRLLDGKPAPFTGPTIQIGGNESYEARCRDCWQNG